MACAWERDFRAAGQDNGAGFSFMGGLSVLMWLLNIRLLRSIKCYQMLMPALKLVTLFRHQLPGLTVSMPLHISSSPCLQPPDSTSSSTPSFQVHA